MKISRTETHDRLDHFLKDQRDVISQGVEDCLKKNPLSLAMQDKSHYVYIFAHPRTLGMDEKMDLFSRGGFDDFSKVPDKVMMWQPRLVRPGAQTNSYLFRAISHTDQLEICWMLPPREMWDQYKKGNLTENELVIWSIDQFTNHREKLELPLPDDLPESRVRDIYMEIAKDMSGKKFEMI